MNGFIYFEATGEQPDPDLKRLGVLDAGMRFHEESFIAGDSFVGWGNASGDIHCCRNGSSAFLILSGYISEIKNGPVIADQQQAARVLLRNLESDCSDRALRALLERLHGSFGIYYRDSRKGVSLCLSDRIASRPIYKFWNGKAWIISSHANAIAFMVSDVKIDPGALGAFLLYAGPLEPRKSLYGGVEALTPGSVAKLGDAGAVEESRLYRFCHRPDNAMSLSAWIDLAAERLTRSASRIARQCERPVVFFSGGVDSRLAAAVLKSVGANPLLVTLGDSRNIEVRVAQQAAKALDLEHVVILRDNHWYLRSLPKHVFETGGSFLWGHGHFSGAIGDLGPKHGADAFILGDFCEAFSKLLCADEMDKHRLFRPDEFTENFDGMRPLLYRANDRGQTLSLLNPAIRSDVESALTEDMVKRYEGLYSGSTDPQILADQFSRWASAATISTFFMFFDVRSAAAERNLMFDRDIHELLEIMPARIREERNLGAKLVKRFSPRAGWVINSNSLLPICWPLSAHKFSKKCKPLLGRARRMILGSSHRTTGAWPDKAMLYVTDLRWRGYIDSVLGDGDLFPSNLFDYGRVRATWDAFKNGERRRVEEVEKLLQLGILNKARSRHCVSAFAENMTAPQPRGV
jgi:hypothetical protein